jgi:4-aminobutyrate aminotransferase/(S)-3-amino-2-methylpropionate transaminase
MREPAPEETKQVMDYCYKHGLITLTAGSYSNVVRLLVPLIISDEQMNEGLDVLEAALHSIAEKNSAVPQSVS